MLTPYEISFRHEIMNEFAAHITGFIGRNYDYLKKPVPPEIQKLEHEAFMMERCFTLNDNEEKLDRCLTRLIEIRDYVWANTPEPHR